MDDIREATRKKQQQIDDFENTEGSQEEIDKLKRELRSLEMAHQTASEKHIQSFAEQQAERDIQLIEDSQATDLEKEEEENASEALKAIRRRKEALDWRIRLEGNKVLDPDASSERIEAAKNKLAEVQESYAKITEEEKVFQKKPGVKSAALEKEIKKSRNGQRRTRKG